MLLIFELWLQLFAIPLYPLLETTKNDKQKAFNYWTKLSVGHWLLHIY